MQNKKLLNTYGMNKMLMDNYSFLINNNVIL